MPITKSAKRAVRSSERKRIYNERRKRAMRDLLKKIEKLIKTDKAKAASLVPSAFQAIDKAAKQGVIKKNNAARKKSRLFRMLK